MHFGADYYPEHWVFPYAGTEQEPESRWRDDARLMVEAGMNVVRMGEFSWGLCEREPGKYDFAWLRRAMDTMHGASIQVVLGTPTAAPPIWLSQKHPEILPLDEHGIPKREGTRRSYCLNSDIYWDYSKKIVTAMAKALGDHPALIAWQIDNAVGRQSTEYSFNPETKRDWHAWLKAKYENIGRLNDLLGLRFWGQVVSDWSQVPMPMSAPASHNPALVTDWRRFSSDTCVAFVRMQADLLRELTPKAPTTTTFRAFTSNVDYFDLADTVDFVSVDSDATVHAKAAEVSCSIDYLRSMKKVGSKAPGGGEGFWVMEQKAGHVSWSDVNSLVRPKILRLFTYQLISRGANGALYFYWRQPRIGAEKFYGGVLAHDGLDTNRTFVEVSQIGGEMKNIGDALQDTRVTPEVCILVSSASDWAYNQPQRPNKYFNQKEHLLLYYTALHSKNIPVDFARPSDDLSQYKLVIAPSLHMLAGGEADMLKMYVQNGGTLVATFNTGLVNEYHIAPDGGYPGELADLFGMRVLEFDPLPPGEENHLTIKGNFQTSHMHSARIWCDIIEPHDCQIIATFAKDFYATKPAITMNEFGNGRAIYVGTMSGAPFYSDFVVWLRQLCGLVPLLRVPDSVEVSMREKEGRRVYFLINHHHTQVRVQLFKPMYDLINAVNVSGNLDLPAHAVMVLDEHAL